MIVTGILIITIAALAITYMALDIAEKSIEEQERQEEDCLQLKRAGHY
jgi:hypothetical protein